jgi:amphi-Trp domain-containing protein
VTDQSQNANDAEVPETEENEEEEFELEGLMTRKQGASVLRRLADGVENASVELGRDEGPVTVPERFEVEVEYEEEADEAELEVELEWSMVDGEAVSAEDDESDETEETEVSEEEADDQE